MMNKYYKSKDILSFGKNKGNSLQFVLDNDCGYLAWAYRTIKGFRISTEARIYLANNFNKLPKKVNPAAVRNFGKITNTKNNEIGNVSDEVKYVENVLWDIKYIKDFLHIKLPSRFDEMVPLWSKYSREVFYPDNCNLEGIVNFTSDKGCKFLSAGSLSASWPTPYPIYFSLGFPLTLMKEVVKYVTLTSSTQHEIYIIDIPEKTHECYISDFAFEEEYPNLRFIGRTQSDVILKLDDERLHEGHLLLILDDVTPTTIPDKDIAVDRGGFDVSDTYTEFNGSYAQDFEGYSDQTINDAFEGDPDIYWNID